MGQEGRRPVHSFMHGRKKSMQIVDLLIARREKLLTEVHPVRDHVYI